MDLERQLPSMTFSLWKQSVKRSCYGKASTIWKFRCGLNQPKHFAIVFLFTAVNLTWNLIILDLTLYEEEEQLTCFNVVDLWKLSSSKVVGPHHKWQKSIYKMACHWYLSWLTRPRLGECSQLGTPSTLKVSRLGVVESQRLRGDLLFLIYFSKRFFPAMESFSEASSLPWEQMKWKHPAMDVNFVRIWQWKDPEGSNQQNRFTKDDCGDAQSCKTLQPCDRNKVKPPSAYTCVYIDTYMYACIYTHMCVSVCS